MVDFITRWTYKLTGRKVPVFRVIDVGTNGLIKSLSLLQWVDRPNSLYESWEVKGAEKSPNGEGLIQFVNEKSLTVPAYVEYKGRTCNLYVRPRGYPNVEKVIGSGVMIDDLAEALDMGKSMRNIVIGILIGIMLGWLFIGPAFNTMLS